MPKISNKPYIIYGANSKSKYKSSKNKLSYSNKIPPKKKKKGYQVFRREPTVGRCYEYTFYDTLEINKEGDRKYFSNTRPVYIGKYIRPGERASPGERINTPDEFIFEKNGEEHSVARTLKMCFIWVACPDDDPPPGGGRRKRKSRRKKHRKKRTKKKHRRKTKRKRRVKRRRRTRRR